MGEDDRSARQPVKQPSKQPPARENLTHTPSLARHGHDLGLAPAQTAVETAIWWGRTAIDLPKKNEVPHPECLYSPWFYGLKSGWHAGAP